MADRQEHWNRVYESRPDSELSWFEAEPAVSLALVKALCPPTEPVIDIGGGEARLVDSLLDHGYRSIAVLDLSEAALRASRERLGARAKDVDWIVADVTAWAPETRYTLWHDRAVFHFLAEDADRAAYVAAMDAALKPGGVAIIATFALEGPDRCSGLPVVRYSSASLAATLDGLAPGRFSLERQQDHVHVTPAGRSQRFQVSVFRKTEDAA